MFRASPRELGGFQCLTCTPAPLDHVASSVHDDNRPRDPDDFRDNGANSRVFGHFESFPSSFIIVYVSTANLSEKLALFTTAAKNLHFRVILVPTEHIVIRHPAKIVCLDDNSPFAVLTNCAIGHTLAQTNSRTQRGKRCLDFDTIYTGRILVFVLGDDNPDYWLFVVRASKGDSRCSRKTNEVERRFKLVRICHWSPFLEI